jgi:hypothetical protein
MRITALELAIAADTLNASTLIGDSSGQFWRYTADKRKEIALKFLAIMNEMQTELIVSDDVPHDTQS